ncbi:MAG TPA: hypothetical protein VLE19_17730 [Pyrinomonadaceae bacterium]|nr:hypothetical protein [Pyrinomonadaceae bacterium]
MKKLVLLVMVAVLTNIIPCGQAMAQQTAPNDDVKHTERIKKAVSKTGASLDREVTVKLRDNTEIRGWISEIADDHFVVKSTSGAPYTFPYAQVEKLTAHKFYSGRQDPVSTPSLKPVIAGVAIGIGVIVIACVASRRCMN